MFAPRLGVSLHTISPTLTDELLAAVAATASVCTVELYPPLLDTDPQGARLAALRALLNERGIKVATVHARFGGEFDVSVLDAAKRATAVRSALSAVDTAAAWHAPMAVVHASAEPIAPPEREQRLANARAALAEIAAAAQACGVRIAVEWLPRTCLGNSVAELRRLLDGLPPESAGVCLDVNHLMDRFADLPRVVRALGAILFTLHLSDYDGVDEKHWLPGIGVIDWATFLDALRTIDYQGPFNYEAKPEGETCAERAQSLERNFAWLRGLLPCA